MIQLPNGCNCSGTPGDPKKGTKDLLPVYPKNWESSNVSIKKDWYVHYYFRDPLLKDKHPKGKYVVAKNDINYLKTREERQEAVKIIMATHLKMLKIEGYNPILDKFITPSVDPEVAYDIPPETLLLEALEKAKKRLNISPGQRDNITSTLKYFGVAARQLRYDQIEIQHIKRKHIRFALDHCAKCKEYWTDSLFNNYRRDLSMLFNELIQTETVEYNPIDKIDKKVTIKKIPRILTPEERKKLNTELRASNYRLWRLMHIFFHSGSRRSEMVHLQLENVDLQKQEFKILIKKGGIWSWVIKPIKDIVLPLWKQLIEEANATPGITGQHYLFSRGLLPYPKPVRAEQITRRWRLWVKIKLGIDANFYCLKASNTDETSEMTSIYLAAAGNSHTNVRTTIDFYAPGEAKRKREEIKKINNVFA